MIQYDGSAGPVRSSEMVSYPPNSLRLCFAAYLWSAGGEGAFALPSTSQLTVGGIQTSGADNMVSGFYIS